MGLSLKYQPCVTDQRSGIVSPTVRFTSGARCSFAVEETASSCNEWETCGRGLKRWGNARSLYLPLFIFDKNNSKGGENINFLPSCSCCFATTTCKSGRREIVAKVDALLPVSSEKKKARPAPLVSDLSDSETVPCSAPCPLVKSRTINGITEGFAGVVPRHMRHLSRRGNN